MIRSLTVPTHWSETHPLHPLDPPVGRKTMGKRAPFASYYGQWRVGFVVGTEFNNWRRARVQDKTTSWISRSPTFVNSRTWRRVCTMSSAVTGFVGLRQARRGRRISRAAPRTRRGDNGLAPEVRGFAFSEQPLG